MEEQGSNSENPSEKEVAAIENQETDEQISMKEPLGQHVRQRTKAIGGKVKSKVTEAVDFAKEHKGEIAAVAILAGSVVLAVVNAKQGDSDKDGYDGPFLDDESADPNDACETASESAPLSEAEETSTESRILYSTNEYKGYGKHNYYHNSYRLEGDQVVRYKCHRFKDFDGDESTWVNTEKVDETWDVNDTDSMPEWLPKYL